MWTRPMAMSQISYGMGHFVTDDFLQDPVRFLKQNGIDTYATRTHMTAAQGSSQTAAGSDIHPVIQIGHLPDAGPLREPPLKRS